MGRYLGVSCCNATGAAPGLLTDDMRVHEDGFESVKLGVEETNALDRPKLRRRLDLQRSNWKMDGG